MEGMQLVWLVLLVLFLVLEGVTSALVSLWFCVGAVVAMVVSFVAPEAVVVQFLVFAAVSLITLLVLRPALRKAFGAKNMPTNADASIGKQAEVIVAVSPGHFGRVNLEGQEWTAKSDYILPIGTWCRVEKIEGVKLVVVPLSPPL